MSLPILEKISQAIVDALELITEANGYNTEVEAVERPTRTGGVTPRDKSIVLQQGDWKLSEDQVTDCTSKKQEYFVTLWLRQSEKSTDPIDSLINYFQADVEKALMVDEQYGGLVLQSILTGGMIIESDDGELEGMTLMLETEYRTKVNDPYTLG